MTTARRQAEAAGAAGFTLIETVFALTILMIVAAGVMPLALVAVKATENQGHLAARTTEYAQDKLEQLMSLSYGDSATDTRVFPSAERGRHWSDDRRQRRRRTRRPTIYVDYLDIDGNLVEADGDDAGTDWFYKRVWQVSSPRANLKLISVTATVRVAAQGGVGSKCRAPRCRPSRPNPF